jgi:hypothetical protein
MTVSEAAAALEISDRRVRRLIDLGQLQARQTLACWVIDRAAVPARVAAAPTGGRPPAVRTVWAMLDELAAVDMDLFAQWITMIDRAPSGQPASPAGVAKADAVDVDAVSSWLTHPDRYLWTPMTGRAGLPASRGARRQGQHVRRGERRWRARP